MENNLSPIRKTCFFLISYYLGRLCFENAWAVFDVSWKSKNSFSESLMTDRPTMSRLTTLKVIKWRKFFPSLFVYDKCTFENVSTMQEAFLKLILNGFRILWQTTIEAIWLMYWGKINFPNNFLSKLFFFLFNFVLLKLIFS